jgi:hypothetical protein
MSTFEDFKNWFTKDNIITVVLVLLVVAFFYVNMKINDVAYRLQQTIMYSPLKAEKDRSLFTPSYY